MVFTVGIGSGAAIIPCGNRTTAIPYTRGGGGGLLFPDRTRSRNLHLYLRVACAKKKKADLTVSGYLKLLSGDFSDFDEEPILDEETAAKLLEKLELELQQPEFWEGLQWEWFGTFLKYSWIIAIAVAVPTTLFNLRFFF